MHRAAILALALAASATPSLAQGNMTQMLGGLLSGNQNQDNAVREAYERGYQRGRQDEAALSRNQPQRGPSRGQYGNQGGYDDRSPAPYPYSR